MTMRRTPALVLIFITFSLSLARVPQTVGQTDFAGVLDRIDADKAWSTVEHLAGDDFVGRKAGTQGADLASEYLASHFNSIGLKPAGAADTYRTEFTMPLWELLRTPSLALVDTAGNALQTFRYRRDYYVQQGSDGADFSAEVIFAGYGITATSLGYDDYAGISASGKIVLAIIGTPPSDRFGVGNLGSWPSKAENAINHGAVGLILIDSPAEPTSHYIERWSGGWTIYRNFAILRGSIGMADALLNDSGRTLSSVQQTINQQMKPQPFALNKRLRVSMSVNFTENANAYNVLGFILGSDPAASGRAVVIGAHYDHLGKDVDGNIFRGANDDASGVAVMMEIARVFAPSRPRWSILFAAWSGEEEGLYGSYTYVSRPYFPLGGTIAYLNLDMVGFGQELTAEVSATHKDLRSIMSESAKQLNVSLNVEGYAGGSDHVPFEKSGVPNVLFIYWPDEVYHTPADVAAHVSRRNMLETARLTTLIALKLAEANVAISFVNAGTTTVIPGGTNSALYSVQTPVEITSVEPIMIVAITLLVAGAAVAFLRRRSRQF